MGSINNDRIKVLYLDNKKSPIVGEWDFDLIRQLRADNVISDLWVIDLKSKKTLVNTLAESLASGVSASKIAPLITEWNIKDTDLDSHIKDNLKLKKGTKKDEVIYKDKSYKGLSKIETLGLIAKDLGYVPNKMQEVTFEKLLKNKENIK